MKLARTLGALAVATALSTTMAHAADLPDAAMAYASPTFDWDGFYAGVGLAGSAYNTGVTIGQVEGVAGVNFTSGQLLFGAEIYAGWAVNNGGAGSGLVGGEVRAGYLVDPAVLLYISGGGQFFTNGAVGLGTVGAGVEFAVTDDVTLDFEYKFLWNNAALNGHQIGASVLWHF